DHGTRHYCKCLSRQGQPAIGCRSTSRLGRRYWPFSESVDSERLRPLTSEGTSISRFDMRGSLSYGNSHLGTQTNGLSRWCCGRADQEGLFWILSQTTEYRSLVLFQSSCLQAFWPGI